MKNLKGILSFSLAVLMLLSITSCAWINETILGKEHTHNFKNDKQTIAPTCVSEGKETATCKCGVLGVTVIPATGKHTYQNKVCTVCGRKDPTGLSEAIVTDIS